ncbi:hypothetical protein, partial [Bradyrhizobium sp. 164]
LVHGMVSSLESLQIRRNHKPAKTAHPFSVRLSEEWRQVLGVRLECSARSSAAVCQVAASP